MQRILLIDGYNIIHAWPELSALMHRVNLAAARDALIDRVHDYAASSDLWAVVVFDGHHGARQKASAEHLKGMDIVYTGAGETADHYIERAADELDGKDCELFVATADNLEQKTILSRGGARITPKELMEDIRQAQQARRVTWGDKGTRLADRIAPDVLAALEIMRKSGGNS
ncbi:MAG: NYN domain-containing protein [Eubacteriales bacterium]|nr:NYN domain-containing protein [Eubacteriales bacterium]